ncbi:MAG: aminoacyl-tRNA hydrolase [Candidatus Paceibacterota bacterium]
MPIFKHFSQFFQAGTKKSHDQSQPTYLIVGLGNKGDKYEDTRHNIGRHIVASLAADLGGSLIYNPKVEALVASCSYKDREVVVLLPENYMNNSGVSVGRYLNFFKGVYNIIVVHDELDLPLGKIKLSESLNTGGHNGVRSVLDQTTATGGDILRVRVGIGPNEKASEEVKQMRKWQTKNFVLGKFTPTEELDLKEVNLKTETVLKTLISQNREAAQKILNK